MNIKIEARFWARGVIAAAAMAAALAGLSACAGKKTSGFDGGAAIEVVSREDGSGTRGAFIELFGIEVRNADGSRKDLTTKEAVIAKQTDVMITNIVGNRYAIGYISLGSLNDSVKALAIDGAAASAAAVKTGGYPISRPFYIAVRGEPSLPAQDFIRFIMSKEGQAVVAKSYIAVDEAAPSYVSANGAAGKIVVAGSSSVTPVMEKLREAYIAVNPAAAVEVQQSDSSAGLAAAINGACDIGMASRALKDSEKAALTAVQIAIDGIAVIVNKENPAASLTKSQVKAIFSGEAARWSDVLNGNN
ncbi:MAG: substrate-binding domain-containing protein [Spirochaetaceae bacterium]|jgi:phosphate transport system substrate-binding protein|nr:substrate-binding domain-containing protein [Spirochaetaceae bacterium]